MRHIMRKCDRKPIAKWRHADAETLRGVIHHSVVLRSLRMGNMHRTVSGVENSTIREADWGQESRVWMCGCRIRMAEGLRYRQLTVRANVRSM